jgi:predicted phage terminase large subunit-like protein
MNVNDIARIKCFKSFEFFTRYFFKKRTGNKFIISEHHQVIFEALNRVSSGKCRRLIINIAPRYGKTELAVKNFIAHSLAVNPKAKFIHLSYADSLALDNSEAIKDLISSQEYQELFPYVQIKVDSKAKNKWYTTEGGGVLARSATGQVTGFGAGSVEEMEDFGGAIIIDDPIKPEDADSDTIRDKVNERFDSTIRSRVNSRETPIIVIMQRLHPKDLSGYLIENDQDDWEVISLPAIIDDNQEERRALWPFKHTLQELDALRKSNERVFERQYMQNPKPQEGLLFPENELKRFRGELDKEKIEATIGYIDIADTGEDNHSVPIGKVLDNKIYVDSVLFTKEGTDVNVQWTADLINNHEPEYVRVESNFGGNMYTNLLSPLINDSTILLPVRATANKATRIATLAGFIKEHCVFRDDYEKGSDYDRFMVNLTDYLKNGKSKHDDAPDSLEGLARMAKTFYSHLWEL